jgi:deuterolysin
MAGVHDLSTGGHYTVSSVGRIPFAKEDSNDLSGSLKYKSNKITMNVNGKKAAKVPKALAQLQKRGDMSVVADCSGDQYTQTVTALEECNSLASAAGDNALNGDANE